MICRMDKNELKINIKPLSDNKLWMWVHRKTAEYRRYESKILKEIPDTFKLEKRKTALYFTFWFSNSRSDASNPLKALCDILWKKFDEWDDRMIYHLEVNKVIVPKWEEFIQIKSEYLD